jgi:murein L,D-transpeptidase YafK
VAVRAQREADLRNQFRLASLTLGAPIYIRIFKESKELEVWVERGERFKLFKKYPIARFSGGLGPKTREGDLQAPEGFYAVTAERMNPWSNFHLAFNVGYPNEYDLLRGATGGAIMVHGKNDSVGCFAMTDPAIEEIYTIADYALNSGQLSFPVHIFPFRMTVANLMRHTRSPHLPFWRNLLRGYTLFELTRLPPTVSLNNQVYAFAPGSPSRPTLVAQIQPPARTTQPATARILPQNPRPGQQPDLQETRPAAPAQVRLTATQATRTTPPATTVRRSGQTIP